MSTGRHSDLATLLSAVGARLKPTFLIIGAQKSGTSALFAYLARHPHVVPPAEKEIHFFDQEANYRQGTLWYHLHFPSQNEQSANAVTFEATPYYLYYPQAAARIYRYHPRLKLIALLRNPIDRAYSAWNMVYRLLQEHSLSELMRRIQAADDPEMAALARLFAQVNPENRAGMTRLYLGKTLLSFDEAVHQEVAQIQGGETNPYPDFVHRGLYYQQLRRYGEYFPPQQLLVLDSRRLKEEPAATLHQIAHFLGLPDYPWEQEDFTFAQSPYPRPLSPATRVFLREFYRPHNEQLYTWLGRDFGWQ